MYCVPTLPPTGSLGTVDLSNLDIFIRRTLAPLLRSWTPGDPPVRIDVHDAAEANYVWDEVLTSEDRCKVEIRWDDLLGLSASSLASPSGEWKEET